MRIVYIANFEAGGNDDENAIKFAFEQLGHEVLPVREIVGYRSINLVPRGIDLVLFHKYADPENTLRKFEGACPRAFWWFDLVDWPSDPTLKGRNDNRRAWMERTIPNVEYGFLSDGDWVDQDSSGKLHWLPQGADERIVGRAEDLCPNCERTGWRFDLLFTGISKGGGERRMSFVDEMVDRYGKRFRHVPRGVHREELAAMVAAARIVVCPDSPVTHKYWSNRVWNALGFGGFVLHPYCERLSGMVVSGREIGYYASREHLHELIEQYLPLEKDRREIADRGLERVKQMHLYRHRCERLLEILKQGGRS